MMMSCIDPIRKIRCPMVCAVFGMITNMVIIWKNHIFTC